MLKSKNGTIHGTHNERPCIITGYPKSGHEYWIRYLTGEPVNRDAVIPIHQFVYLYEVKP